MTADVILYSIGHSDHKSETLIALLRRYGVATVVDVRSQPYSRWVPQANRETLAQALEQAGLTYVFMGDVLGGRPADPSLYEATEEGETPEGIRPDYERMAATPTFQAGIRRLLTMAASATVAMMCSEGDFRRCHRALLITPSLLEQGARVIHIHPDGKASEAQPEPKQLSLF
jgi:uncharacterized protein (DUF488 family)